jgi:hypothetical protein
MDGRDADQPTGSAGDSIQRAVKLRFPCITHTSSHSLIRALPACDCIPSLLRKDFSNPFMFFPQGLVALSFLLPCEVLFPSPSSLTYSPPLSLSVSFSDCDPHGVRWESRGMIVTSQIRCPSNAPIVMYVNCNGSSGRHRIAHAAAICARRFGRSVKAWSNIISVTRIRSSSVNGSSLSCSLDIDDSMSAVVIRCV